MKTSELFALARDFRDCLVAEDKARTQEEIAATFDATEACWERVFERVHYAAHVFRFVSMCQNAAACKLAEREAR